MRRMMVLAFAVTLAACGGGDDADTRSGDTTAEAGDTESGNSASSSGEVVDPQPPGQASFSAGGQEFVFDTLGPSDCIIETDRISFAFADAETGATLGAGANLTDDGWQGDFLLRVLDEDGLPVQYYPQKSDGFIIQGTVAVDTESMSFSGPMEMNPPNDGSNPPPLAIGDGTISVTCG